MGKEEEDDAIDALLQLYGIEAGLVQEKINHILTIRSLAFTVMAAIVGASILYSSTNIVVLLLILVPFYVLECSYNGYLIHIVERETQLRKEISSYLDTKQKSDLAKIYRASFKHRWAQKKWNPFYKSMVEPVRMIFYGSIVLIVLAIQFGEALVDLLAAII